MRLKSPLTLAVIGIVLFFAGRYRPIFEYFMYPQWRGTGIFYDFWEADWIALSGFFLFIASLTWAAARLIWRFVAPG